MVEKFSDKDVKKGQFQCPMEFRKKSNIKGVISYSGTHYLGFQKNNIGPTIEQILEEKLCQILGHTVQIQGASRTDRGVHALGQVINFFTPRNDLSLHKLHQSLRGILPKDIAALELEEVGDSFHPTLDALGKEYHYHICNTKSQLPFYREFSWHYHIPLDLEKMEKAASFLIGEHDFSAFSNEVYEDPIRKVTEILLISLPEGRIRISIQGNRFLYKMVRNIVGTLVYVGCGKISLEEIPYILASKDRTRAGMTAPAHGLTLHQVFY